MYQVPKPSDMFSDAPNAAAVAERFEAYKTVLADGNAKSVAGELTTQNVDGHPTGVTIVKNTARQAQKIGERVDTLTKALTAEQQSALSGELDALKTMLGGDLNK